MANEIKLSVFEIVGSPLCVSSEDGQRVYDRIESALKEERQIVLSFQNITSLTSAFLNTAIGQLYSTFSEEKIRGGVKVSDMESDDLVLLKRVVETAKAYFRAPDRFNQAKREALGEEDE
jgi:hypothetical protein